MTYIIYTDGSDLKHTSHRMGIGGVLLEDEDSEELDSFSEELSHDYLRFAYGTSDCSNPTAEMIAAKYALEKWKSKFSNGDNVIMYADYEGVQKWNQGKWQAKKPYIRKIRDEIKELIRKAGIYVDWRWVKGHQTGSSIQKYWNDKVDKLAKGL